MGIVTLESAVDCGDVRITDEATTSPKEALPPIDPQNPGPGIDARLNRAINALSRTHPDTPKEEFFLGL